MFSPSLLLLSQEKNFDGEEQPIYRNGGEKNYLEYMIKSPKSLATCLYGIPFILLGTAAGNSLIFAISIFRAAGVASPNDYAVRGIIYSAGGLGGSGQVASNNLNIHDSTKDAINSTHGYAEAFLAILFTYGGFKQATYVLGEIKDPRRRFTSTTIWTVFGVVLLFCMVNLSYMMVVPALDQYADGEDTVVTAFFRIIFGETNANEIQYSLMAFSALGNILVQTFTAARVKQEIAKEGILPFSKFFADNKSVTPRLLRMKSDSSNQFSEATPVGALCLHWMWSMILILASIPAGNSADTYRIYVDLYSFVVDAVFGFAVGLGILILRLLPSAGWDAKSTSNKYASIGTAFIFTLGNLFPLVTVWLRPSSDSDVKSPLAWYAIGKIGVGVLAIAFLWWIGLAYIVPKMTGSELAVGRKPTFVQPRGYRVVYKEITSVNWRTRSSSASEAAMELQEPRRRLTSG